MKWKISAMCPWVVRCKRRTVTELESTSVQVSKEGLDVALRPWLTRWGLDLALMVLEVISKFSEFQYFCLFLVSFCCVSRLGK